MALIGWLLDKSAAARRGQPEVAQQLGELTGQLVVCPAALLEQLYSARSGAEYDEMSADYAELIPTVPPAPDVFDRALALQRDLAHHHGLWHRIPIPDLLIAEAALHHGLGVVHVDGDFDRIAEVRPLRSRRLGTGG